MSQKKTYLGFEVDSQNMIVKAKPAKMRAVKEAITNITKHKRTEAKKLAAVICKTIALEPALGPVVQLLTRPAQMDLAEAVQDWGWKAKIHMSDLAVDSMLEVLEHMEEFNGAIIKTTATATPLRAILDKCTAGRRMRRSR